MKDVNLKLSDCLLFDPFFGDETPTIVLSDVLSTANKDHTCYWCGGPVYKGEIYRKLTEVFREEKCIASTKYCFSCCLSFVISGMDNGEYCETRFGKNRKDPKEVTEEMVAETLATIAPNRENNKKTPFWKSFVEFFN